MDTTNTIDPARGQAERRVDVRWLDTWMEWFVLCGVLVGGPLGTWSPSFLRDAAGEASGTAPGVWSADLMERLLGGILFGGLGALVLALLLRAGLHVWAAVVRD